MEIEFDKEIDAILRKARSGEAVASFDSHPDADEISAFAENSLSDAARKRYTMHLADCTRCRKILSNLIVLNAEAETETASSGVSAEIAEVKTPWYRKLFVFPQLVYTMGALVLLFSGFFGYVVLKNLTGSDEKNVSYSTDTANRAEKPIQQPAMSAPANVSTANTTTTTTATNSSAPVNPSFSTNSSSNTNSAPVRESNPTAFATPQLEEKKLAEPEKNLPIIQATPLMKPDAPKDQPINSGDDRDKLSVPQPSSPIGGVSRANTAKEENKKKAAEDSDGSTADKSATENQDLRLKSPAPKSARKQESYAGATRNVGGRTFNNIGGTWYDSAYTKQKQKTVNRGTSEYLKLDSGLRSIADSLGGTVVILWNGKAYKIQ